MFRATLKMDIAEDFNCIAKRKDNVLQSVEGYILPSMLRLLGHEAGVRTQM